jgi:D-3-phosphoglycerate dehydrogenase
MPAEPHHVAGRRTVLVGPAVEESLVELLAHPELAQALSQLGDVRFSRAPSGSAGLAAELDGVDAVLLTGRLSAQDIAATSVGLVSVTATGYGFYVDARALDKLGVRVAYVPSYGEQAIAEHALALVMAAAKNVLSSHDAVRAGRWPQPMSLQLAGSVAGVVGVGPVGNRMIRLLEGLGMEVLAWTRTPEDGRLRGTQARWASLDELFERADVVSLHLAATDETRGIIDRRLLGRLRPGAVVVNTARAELIQAGALEWSVRERRVRAAVDVLPVEPPARDFVDRLPDSLIVTPHVAFNTPAAARTLVRRAVDNIAAFFDGGH